jgi:FAD/FMN-containing dehydrogenase
VLGRTYGLTCDRMTAAQVVLADGSLITCDDTSDSDLYWARRGAGAGNFGVVTPSPFAPSLNHKPWPFISAGPRAACPKR